MRRRRRSCANGHPYTAENTRIRKARRWLKKSQQWKTFEVRTCIRCTRVLWRLNSRRRRAEGKLLSYPQWAASVDQGNGR